MSSEESTKKVKTKTNKIKCQNRKSHIINKLDTPYIQILSMYFHLDKDYQIKFLDEQVEKSIIIGVIKWPYLFNDRTVKLYITLDYEVHQSNNSDQAQEVSVNFTQKDLAILRSQLQKCARRKKRKIGTSSAKTMVGIYQNQNPQQIGLFEMLRRLTIIVIEDCVLLREYGELVWYQCALSKNFKLNKKLVQRTVLICDKIMAGEWKDKSYRFEKEELNLFNQIIKSKNLSVQDRDLLLAIQLRNSFHGMPCDVSMLNQCTKIWLHRFEENHKLIIHLDCEHKTNDKNLDFSELNRDQIQLEALDHHCTDICQRVSNIFPIEKDLLEKIIWDYRSSINKRLDIDLFKNRDLYDPKENKELWSIIKPLIKIQALSIKEELLK